MAVAYKCDRCGKYFDKNASTPKALGFHFKVTPADWHWPFIVEGNETLDWAFTLCFSCMSVFNKEFMHAPGFRFEPNMVVEDDEDAIDND